MTRCTFALAAALLLAACGDDGGGVYQGYAEGETVIVAAPAAGWIVDVAVTEGADVEAGDPLFRLEPDREAAQAAAAEARVAQARAQLEDLRKGRRPEEIAQIEEQLREARARARLARQEFERAQALRRQGTVAQARADQAAAERDAAEARVAQLAAALEAARLPARGDAIAAGESALAAAEAQAREAAYALSQRQIASRVAGRVESIARRAGEFVPAGGAVLALLPDPNIKIRFFVPEPERAAIAPGRRVRIACDGCPEPIPGRVTFVAAEAEYTPPVIYSREQRAKLVYRVEAQTDAPGALRPGQPVDVTLEDAP